MNDNKPEGSGHIERSVRDRYSSMNAPTGVKPGPAKADEVQPHKSIGDKAGTPTGYKPFE